MGSGLWADTGPVLYGTIMTVSVPIFVLSVVVTAWTTDLSASNRHAVQDALGFRNLIVAGACGMSGSVGWIVGTMIIINNGVPGLLILFLSVALWVIVMVMTPWDAGSTLSKFFESIHSSKAVSQTITALLALVSVNVISFVAMFSVMVTQAPVGSQTAPPGSVVSRVSDGVDGASMFKPNISSPHPPDLERNLPDSDGASTAPAEQGPTSADNMEKPEIQDGAA